MYSTHGFPAYTYKILCNGNYKVIKAEQIVYLHQSKVTVKAVQNKLSTYSIFNILIQYLLRNLFVTYFSQLPYLITSYFKYRSIQLFLCFKLSPYFKRLLDMGLHRQNVCLISPVNYFQVCITRAQIWNQNLVLHFILFSFIFYKITAIVIEIWTRLLMKKMFQFLLSILFRPNPLLQNISISP